MEHHHISAQRPYSLHCIDIYLDNEGGEVRIIDALNTDNKIAISRDDWNELIERIRKGVIGGV